MWVDVAFDVLYVGDTSVIHQSLKERHELLRKVVKPIKGSLEILVPNGGLNAHRATGKQLHFEANSLKLYSRMNLWIIVYGTWKMDGVSKRWWQWLFMCMYVNINSKNMNMP